MVCKALRHCEERSDAAIQPEQSKSDQVGLLPASQARGRNDVFAEISTDWDVELIHTRLDTTIHTHFDTLFDLKDHPETQHFAGTIVYRKTIPMDTIKPCVLDLGLVEGVSEVFVNSQSAGVKYYGRRIYDIKDLLHEGDNDLEIRVTTTLGNYMKTITKEENPTTWIYVNHPKRDQPLQPMGLLGPVKLYQTERL